MNNNNTTKIARLVSLTSANALALGIILALPQVAQAQAGLSFIGGGGSPLTITISAPITYTLTAGTGSNFGPYFIFQGLGNLFPSGGTIGTSTVTFTRNGGSPRTINNISGGVMLNDVSIASLPTTTSPLTAGDTIVLSAGAITTSSNVSSPAPANGLYTTFIVNNNGTTLSSNGVSSVSAPEPTSSAFIVIGSLVMVARRRQRKQNADVAVSKIIS
jgi:hypothetical protein